jgi:hypothetical protein
LRRRRAAPRASIGEEVACADGAFGGTRTDDRVQLVDEEDDPASADWISFSTAFSRPRTRRGT